MGFYLNSKKPSLLFQEEALSAYFVDKTDILNELVPLIEAQSFLPGAGQNRGKGYKYVCITRPRRFGKTVIARLF